jgi:MFS family permease
MSALGVSFNAIQFVVTGYLLTMTALAVYAGRLGDMFGKRRLLFTGLGVFAIASLLCTIAPNLAVLVAGRALQGAGAALLNALAMALVVDVLPPGKAGAGLGFLSATSATGTMIGPTVGAFLIAFGGWRAIFAVSVPLAIIVFVVLAFTLPVEQAGARVRAGLSAGGRMPPLLLASLAGGFLVSCCMVSTLVLAPFLLTRAYGLPIHAVGLVMGAGPLTTVLFALVAGRFADKLDARAVTVAGLAIFLVGALSLATLNLDRGLVAYLISVILIGGGWGLFQTSNNHVVLNECEPGRRGAVSGWLSLSRNVGLIAGTALVSLLFSTVTHGDAESGSAVLTAVHAAFSVNALMIGLAEALMIYIYLNRPAAAAL